MLHGMCGFNSIGCSDWWYACSLCAVWVLSPLASLILDMPYLVWYLLFVILHGFCLLFLFLFDITWCMYYRDYGLCFGGVSYSSVSVPPPLFVFPVVLIVCIPSFLFLLLCFVCLFFFHTCP